MKKVFRKAFSYFLVTILVLTLFSCGNSSKVEFVGDLYIYNFGDYMSEEALEIFEKETGIKVHQDLFGIKGTGYIIAIIVTPFVKKFCNNFIY